MMTACVGAQGAKGTFKGGHGEAVHVTRSENKPGVPAYRWRSREPVLEDAPYLRPAQGRGPLLPLLSLYYGGWYSYQDAAPYYGLGLLALLP